MSIGSALAIYFVLWWIVLFAVLPFGVRGEAGEGVPGADPGAPALPMMLRKALWTTLISAVLFAAAYYAYAQGLFNVERLARIMGLPI
jgi:predicted secreted protein